MISVCFVFCSSSDFWEVDGLPIIFKICVCCKFFAIISSRFKNNYGFSGKGSSIKRKNHIYRSRGFFRSKCGFGSNLFLIYFDRLSGFFIHKGSSHNIFFAGQKIFVSYRIYKGNFFICLGKIHICFLIFCSGPDFWEIDSLILICNVRMNSQF